MSVNNKQPISQLIQEFVKKVNDDIAAFGKQQHILTAHLGFLSDRIADTQKFLIVIAERLDAVEKKDV